MGKVGYLELNPYNFSHLKYKKYIIAYCFNIKKNFLPVEQ